MSMFNLCAFFPHPCYWFLPYISCIFVFVVIAYFLKYGLQLISLKSFHILKHKGIKIFKKRLKDFCIFLKS